MSGPKVTVYYLTEEQRAAIRAERLRKQREREKRNKLVIGADGYQAQLKSMLQSVDQFAPTLDALGQWMPDSPLPAAVRSFSASVSKVQIAVKTALQERELAALERKLKPIPGQIADLRATLAELTGQEQAAREEMRGLLAENVSGLFRQGEVQQAQTKAQAALEEKKEQARQTLATARSAPYLPITYQRELEAAAGALDGIQNAEFMENYIAIKLTPLVRKCADFSALWEKSGKEYQQLYARYEALLQETGSQEQAEMIPFDREAAEKLKAAIEELEKKAQEDAERAYISQALSDVMEEMGYGMWGEREVRKRSGRRFRSELYHYGADTAINVTFSDDGTISMELGKVDHEDRLPTGLESRAMEQEMHRFCDHFHVIEERLAQKGVRIGDRVMLAPPSAEYAQIINLGDYDTAGADRQAAQKKKTGERKLQREQER